MWAGLPCRHMHCRPKLCSIGIHRSGCKCVSILRQFRHLMENIPVVTAATAIDDEATGNTTILVLGQAIYMGDKINNTLLCPNQLRYYGITVDNVPMHLTHGDKTSSHSIICPEHDMAIPLSLKGILSYFQSRIPTPDELLTCKRIILTDENSRDPHADTFQSQEENFKNHVWLDYNPAPRNICSLQHTALQEISNIFDNLFIAFILIAFTQTTQWQFRNPAKKLASLWRIGLETAKKTLKVTTQKGIQNSSHPIEQIFRTRQSQLRYKQLGGWHGWFYTDTMFSSVPSINGCTMAQTYANDIGFTTIPDAAQVPCTWNPIYIYP